MARIREWLAPFTWEIVTAQNAVMHAGLLAPFHFAVIRSGLYGREPRTVSAVQDRIVAGMSTFMVLCWLGGILLVVLLVVVIAKLLKK